METAILVTSIITAILLLIVLASQIQLRQEVNRNVSESIKMLSDILSKNISDMNKNITDKQSVMNETVFIQLKQFEERLKTLETTNEQKLEAMRTTISGRLRDIQEDNTKKLDEIRITVDEKLQKTLDDKMDRSYKMVSDQLEVVNKGLGEMQSLASGVGDLKKVLSNVKNRGILGEIQLGAILSDILAPEQYEIEFSPVSGSRERVEFAIKLPANSSDKYVYLPIDSKFPGDSYAALQEAYEKGDTALIASAQKTLISVIEKSAKDIHEKYISPPDTTNFAVMFLPFEGLYAEVVRLGLIETLQHKYSVSIAGPSTMAALLNALQMGFRTLQIQEKSNEVWTILSKVKGEFAKFGNVLDAARKKAQQLDNELEKLVGTRTNAINRTLKNVNLEEFGETKLITEYYDENDDAD